MPVYTFKHPRKDILIDVFQRMSEEHEYVDEEGVRWKRVFTAPHANVPIVFDPNSSQDFVNKTKGTKGTLGDLWDRSRELSEQRKKKHGEDKV